MQTALSKIRILIGAIVMVYMGSCANYMSQPYKPERARLGPETPVSRALLQLPPPKEKIVAGVYKFRDQTGQYKASENGSSWSTAVTQGATTILIRALEQSGWFMPIERENINNLLNERKIIRSSRAQYEGKESDLPPLLFAGIILEGGIISYETNMLTGGIGIRYFGIGGNAQYRLDRVTVYLRAVSTSSGAVLKTVYTSKTILSQEIKTSIYRYVSLNKILEAEMGYTFNEPSELCVSEAISKAVESLVIEGVNSKYWQLQNQQDTLSAPFLAYYKERNLSDNIDVFGNDIQSPQETGGKYRLGVSVGAEQYNGDYEYSSWRPLAYINSDLALSRWLSFGQNIGYRYTFVSKGFYGEFLDASLDFKGTLYPYLKGSLFMALKGGCSFMINSKNTEISNRYLPYAGAELGYKYRFNSRISLHLTGFYNYMLTDRIDGVIYGDLNDQYWGARIGFFYHF